MKEPKGAEILILGTVQGVGFRPFVYNLAARLNIAGTISNTSDGVRIQAYATPDRLNIFLTALTKEAPPLSTITSFKTKPLYDPFEGDSFEIIASVAGKEAKTSIPPDIALCDDCLSELLDADDLRHRYPFINCTNCGPRFSIVETIPYDRPYTSMKSFPMCEMCRDQYNDPGDRRFHAQPNACPVCGPSVSFHHNSGEQITTDQPISLTAAKLAEAKIVAIRGLGGFHLVADAYSDSAIHSLRERKGRPDKPLAVMMADIKTIETHCYLNEKEKQLLLSPAHPIVLLRNKDHMLAGNLAPGIDELGVMLPYTPLHQLLFNEPDCPDCLVMTSGNVSGAPICTGNEDALARLSSICDYFLLHNRDIVTRVDDSVIRVSGNRSQIYRRARGFVPSPLQLKLNLPPVIGTGGGLKSTFCLAREDSAHLSQHIGDLFNLESFDFYTESVDHLKRLLQIEPKIVACDLHPDYMSTHFAAELQLPTYRIQHHHAHAVSVMAEHGLSDPVLAVVMDGTGYGPDGTIWGGEILFSSLTGYKRLAHLEPLMLPGGDLAAAEPWRMGISALYNAYGEQGMEEQLPEPVGQIPQEKRDVISAMLKAGFNSPLTSSCGRLFDSVASLLGVCQKISYEGQGAIELEALARRAAGPDWLNRINGFIGENERCVLCKDGGKLEIYSSEMIRLVLAALHSGRTREETALLFHCLLIASIEEIILHLSQQTGCRKVVLSGGCMQNKLLLEGLFYQLAKHNVQAFTGERIPINDGGISLGQAIIGGLQHVSSDTHEGY